MDGGRFAVKEDEMQDNSPVGVVPGPGSDAYNESDEHWSDARDRVRRGLELHRSNLVDFLRGLRPDLLLDDEPAVAPRLIDHHHRVALIEDDDVDARVVESLLQQSGLGAFTVTRFRNIGEAEAHLRAGISQVILLDLGLPGVGACDVVTAVRRLAPATPLVVVSGDADESRAVASLRDGAQDYVVKGSLDAGLMARTVRLALGRAEAERSLRMSVVKLLMRSDELSSEVERRAEVEERLREKQDKLSDMVVQLRSASEAQTEFLATVSHELRTPLTSIIGYADLLRDLPEMDLSEMGEHALDIIDRNSSRLLTLVEDLLISAEVDAATTRMARDRVNVSHVVQTVYETLELSAEEKGHDLSVHVIEPLPLIWADQRQLERALLNLVGNSIKFTDPNGTIIISLRPAPNGSGVELTVGDNGIGIAPEDRESVFSKFVRGSRAVEDATPGTGLGLAIVKSIVEGHRGTVRLASELGAGTQFTVTLPTDLRLDASNNGTGSSSSSNSRRPQTNGRTNALPEQRIPEMAKS